MLNAAPLHHTIDCTQIFPSWPWLALAALGLLFLGLLAWEVLRWAISRARWRHRTGDDMGDE